MKKNCKVKPKTKTAEIQKISTFTINKGDTASNTRARAGNKNNLSEQSLSGGQIELLRSGSLFTATPNCDLNSMENGLYIFTCY